MRTRENTLRHHTREERRLLSRSSKTLTRGLHATDWDGTVKIHKKASDLARGFNAFSATRYPIRFTDIQVFYVTRTSDPNSTPKLGQSVTVEDYIEGDFKKWCNNYGFISSDSQSLPAFMHWSWVQTRGELMVADLQGVWTKGDGGRFFLTDPAIISLNNSYGPTDTGAEGMLMFFYHHKCNDFCRSLARPTPSDFIARVPQHELRECMGKLDQLQSATTYTVDLNLGFYTRQIVASVLRSVAARC